MSQDIANPPPIDPGEVQPIADPFAGFLRREQEREDRRLAEAAKYADTVTPEAQPQIQERAVSQGMTLEGARDQLAETPPARSFFAEADARRLRERSPATAQWLEEPNNFALARDDLANLEGIEWWLNLPRVMYRAYGEGNQLVEMGRLGFKMMKGDINDPERTRLTELQSAGIGATDYGQDGWLSSGMVEFARMLPFTVGAFKQGAVGGLATGGAFAIGGNFIPSNWALPEELLTFPTGFAVGSRGGAFNFARQVEAGLAYLEFMDFRDEDGKPLDRDTARAAAEMVGVANGALEIIGLGTLVKAFPGGRRLIGRGLTNIVGDWMLERVTGRQFGSTLAKQSFATAAKNFGKRYLKVIGVETMTEIGQELSVMIAGEVAKDMGDQTFEDLTPEEAISRIREVTIKTMQAMTVMALPGPSGSFYFDMARARDAQKGDTILENIRNQTMNTKLLKNAPASMKTFLKAAASDDYKEVFIGVKDWDEYWESQGQSGATMAAHVLGDTKQYEQAKAVSEDGNSLVIPIETYATTLLTTEHHTGLGDVMAFSQGGFTRKESREFFTSLGTEVKRLEAARNLKPAEREGLDALLHPVREEMKEKGWDEQTIADYMAPVEAALMARAKNQNVPVDQVAAQYTMALNIQEGTLESIEREDEVAIPTPERAMHVATEGVVAEEHVRGVSPRPVASSESFSFSNIDPNRRYKLRYLALPIDEVLTSHDISGAENADFPAVFQQFNRGTATSLMQVSGIAKQPAVPSLTTEQHALDRGAPIVSYEGQVDAPRRIALSGNGRLIGLAMARDSNPTGWAAYQDQVRAVAESLGLEVPEGDFVLVREVAQEMDAAQTEAFTRDANHKTMRAMPAIEQAIVDSELIPTEMLASMPFFENEVLHETLKRKKSADWVRSFFAQLSPQDRSRFGPEGVLTVDGTNALARAIVIRAFGVDKGSQILELIEDVSSPVRSLEGAVYRAVGPAAKLQAMVEQGQIDSGYGITEELGRAFASYADMRDKGQSIDDYLKTGLFTGLDDFTADILRVINEYASRRAPKQLGELLSRYFDLAFQTPTPAQGVAVSGVINESARQDFWDQAKREAAQRRQEAQQQREAEGEAGDVQTFEQRGAVITYDQSGMLFDPLDPLRTYKVVAKLNVQGERGRRFEYEIEASSPDSARQLVLKRLKSSGVWQEGEPEPFVGVTEVEGPHKPDRGAGQQRLFQEGQEQESRTARGPKRGEITISRKDKTFSIALFRAADLSTFLHETGHFFLEFMLDGAEDPNATEQMREDAARVLKWFGVESRDQITREHHEKWAQTYELYLREGKAPSEGLRRVFYRFSVWLRVIYRNIKRELPHASLNPDISDVMDRMLATEEEIAAARSEGRFGPMLQGRLKEELTDEERRVYDRLSMEILEEADREVMADKMQALRVANRQLRRDVWRKAEREARSEVAQNPAYRALHFLQGFGTIDGQPLTDHDENIPFVSKEWVIRTLGRAFASRMPSHKLYRLKGGVDGDIVAPFFGFASGSEMFQAIARLPHKYASHAVKALAREKYERAVEEGGIEPSDDPRVLEDKATKALHRNKRAEMLVFELRRLTQAAGKRGLPATIRLIRQRAGEIIDHAITGDVRSDRYLADEKRAGRLALEAALRGDFDLAVSHKMNQIFNYYLYRMARAAIEDRARGLKYMKTIGKPKRLARIGRGNIDAQLHIINLLTKFGMLKGRENEKPSTSLDAFAAAQSMDEVFFASFLIDHPGGPADRLTVEQFDGLVKTIRSLEHLAREDKKIIDGAKKVELEKYVDEAVGEMLESSRDAPPNQKNTAARDAQDWWKRQTHLFRMMDTWMIKPEQILLWLSGNRPDGAMMRGIMWMFNQADHEYRKRTKAMTRKLVELIDFMPKAIRRNLHEQVYIPEAKDTFTRRQLIVMVLNMGSQSNIDRLFRGEGWLDSEGAPRQDIFDAIASKLTKEELEFVNSIWKLIGSLWPEIVAFQRENIGVAPIEVKAKGFQVKTTDMNGNEVVVDMTGGYFPLKRDRIASPGFAVDESKDAADYQGDNTVGVAMPDAGHLKSRVMTADYVVEKDLHAIPNHINQVLFDLTHRKAFIQSQKILRDKRIRAAIQVSLGDEYLVALEDWIRYLANSRNRSDAIGSRFLNRLTEKLRYNASIVSMGYKFTVAFVQPLGISNALFDVVRPKYMALALNDFRKHPFATLKFIREASGEMANRWDTLDHDIRQNMEHQETLFAHHTGLPKRTLLSVQRYAFFMIRYGDLYASAPVWMAAYRQALAENPEAQQDRRRAIEIADSAVRVSQGAGAAKDLAAVQRSENVSRMITMFYSYFSALYSRLRNLQRDTVRTIQEPSFGGFFDILARTTAIWFVPAIFAELIVGRGPDEDEDWFDWGMRRILLYPMATIPGVRDVVSGLDGYRWQFSPAAAAFEESHALMTKLNTYLKGKTPTNIDRDVFELSGYVFGLPTRQVQVTGGWLWDYMEGDEELAPLSLEFWRDVLLTDSKRGEKAKKR